jgi:type IV pilus assembly protein PilV
MPLKTVQCKARIFGTRQRGISLIEALVALMVLALGIMALAGVQTRLLAESRTSNSRVVAVGLIDDLNNRMLLNRNAALADGYALAWGAAATTAQDCVSNTCTAAQLAQSDLNQWRAALAAALPGADATVFLSPNDARQIGIAIAWKANEGKAADTDSTKYTSPFSVTATLSGVDCPANSICHFAYVQP